MVYIDRIFKYECFDISNFKRDDVNHTIPLVSVGRAFTWILLLLITNPDSALAYLYLAIEND